MLLQMQLWGVCCEIAQVEQTPGAGCSVHCVRAMGQLHKGTSSRGHLQISRVKVKLRLELLTATQECEADLRLR